MIHDDILTSLPEIEAIRRDLHAHPEIRFQERRTSELVADLLSGFGIEVTRGLGKTGLVGTLRVGTKDRCLALRSELDALPMQEENAFPHRSRNDGAMHGCGHDGHMAMLLGAARHLARTRDFDGVVRFIFQPAEEGGAAGAQAMIADGLFTRFPCRAVFGLHNWPEMPAGVFGTRPGPLMASSNSVDIRLTGRGSHAAMPHLGVDPVVLGAQVVLALQTVVSRNVKPLSPVVLSVTRFHAGSAYNVVPDQAELAGTVRTFDTEALDIVEVRMNAILDGLCRAAGASHELSFRRVYPPLVNSAPEAALALEAMTAVAGPEAVQPDLEPTMAAEDFADLLKVVPGCMTFLGAGDGSHRMAGHGPGPCRLHNPSYDFNDALLPLGMAYWAELTRRFLAAGARA